ncbi:MAG: hypothetical protein ACRD30_09740 [Bryobacteraceae bacterium]
MLQARMIFAVAAGAALLHGQNKPAALSIERLALHQFADGPLLPPGYEFVPGETAYFSCRIAGYKTLDQDDKKSVKLAWTMRVADPSGVPIAKERSGAIADRVLPQDKNWIPKFLSSFVIPEYAPTGAYRISITVTDQIAGAEVEGELAFQVRGTGVAPSPTLVTRNFEFLRNEKDSAALRPPVYQPGSTLWARFDIAGYKFGENNQFSVEYGLAVLNSSGEQIFSQPEAASDARESFYPQPFVPGALSLNLDKNVVSGEYTLVVTVRDKIGNQNWETRQPFQVK